MKKIKLEVSLKDMAKATCYESNTNCPLAVALKRLGYRKVVVDPYYVEIGDLKYSINKRAVDALSEYDFKPRKKPIPVTLIFVEVLELNEIEEVGEYDDDDD